MWDKLFGGGIISSVEKIATELIETDKESAEAKAILYKSIDPNGRMRLDISTKVTNMYITYVLLTLVLVLSQSFDIGNQEHIGTAIKSLTDLFTPLTTLFGLIVSASFGVNGVNSYKGINK